MLWKIGVNNMPGSSIYGELISRPVLAWYPAQRKSAWYTLMRFRLIKSGVLTFMTFILFRGAFSDEIYVPTWPS